jgi:hypothetical protein
LSGTSAKYRCILILTNGGIFIGHRIKKYDEPFPYIREGFIVRRRQINSKGRVLEIGCKVFRHNDGLGRFN